MRSIDDQLTDDAILDFARRKAVQETDYLLSLRDHADHGWIIFDEDEGDLVYSGSRWSFALPSETHMPSHTPWSDDSEDSTYGEQHFAMWLYGVPFDDAEVRYGSAWSTRHSTFGEQEGY